MASVWSESKPKHVIKNINEEFLIVKKAVTKHYKSETFSIVLF